MSLLHVKDGYIMDPLSGLEETGDLLIENGRISKVSPGEALESPPSATILEAKGLIVAPGFVDLHAHLREPGNEEKETIASGTLAAAKGGFTTVCCMPNTKPAIDSRATVDFIANRALSEGVVRVLPVGAVTKGRAGLELTEMGELAEAGVVGFSDDGDPVGDSMLMRNALTYSKRFGLPIMDHCQDTSLSLGGVMNEGEYATRLGLKGAPIAAEELMIIRNLQLAEITGGKVHICHMSSAGCLESIKEAKERGVQVTCEVTPHHLTLFDCLVAGEETGEDPSRQPYDTNTKVNPPLRSRGMADALVDWINSGVIDAIATDHAPHATVDKLCEYERAPFGISGFETAFGSLMQLVHSKRTNLMQILRLLTCGPARIVDHREIGLGTLTPGAPGDLVLIDTEHEWRVNAAEFVSKGRNTPLDGHLLKGMVMLTVFGGIIVSDQREIG